MEYLDSSTKRRRLISGTVLPPSFFHVPKNEAEILDMSPYAKTPLRKLKALLLSNSRGAKVSAVVGMGGVGKTTDMCALGYDPEVWSKYRDGIWFIQLGQDANLDDVVDELHILVEEVCSTEFAVRLSELLSRKRGIIRAIRELVKKLDTMHFLLMFDDVWEENEAYTIVKQMASTVYASSGHLKMLISTRRKAVAECPLTNAVVEVDPKDSQGRVARRILCVHARISLKSLPGPSTRAGKAVEYILRRCAGLPLALAVAGSIVRTYMRSVEEGEGCDHSWIMLRDSLSKNAGRLGRRGSSEHKEGLFVCIDASMCLIESKWSSGETGMVRGLLCSLCIFPKQTWIPLGTLQHTWGTNPEYTESFIEMLYDYSIVSHVVRKGKRGLRAHDLVIDYCEELSKQNDSKAVWHKRLVQGYSSELDIVEGGEVRCVSWWSEKLSADIYIRQHVVRHLLGCGMIAEAVLLICDYRWIQMLNGEENHLPFQQCISDLKKIEKSISIDIDATGELIRGVELLRETMELCSYTCSRNQAECSFQLYGRLSSLEFVPDFFARCLWGIERYSTGPWLKPVPGMLKAADGSLKRAVPVSFDIWRMDVGSDADDVVLGGRGGEIKVINLRNGKLRWEVDGHSAEVMGLEVDQQTGEVFSASGDGTVAVWQEGMQQRRFNPFDQRAGGRVSCIKLLLPLKQIACGFSRGTVVLIDMIMGQTVRTMNGHTRGISSLVTDEDGELLISASLDHTIQRWDAKSGLPIGKPLRGHTDTVNCVALSPDMHLIASGSHDATVRLWDTRKGVEVCAALSGHNSCVGSVLFSREGDVLFSGDKGEILVWDVRSPQRIVSLKQRLLHDMDWVTSLRLSRDGQELFATARWEREILVWRAETRHDVSDSRSSNGSFLSEVVVFGISPNGEVMATCSRGSHGTIQVRGVCDVSEGLDNVLCSCPVTEVGRVGQVAVTNDVELVAYSSKRWGSMVYIARASTGEVVYKLKGLIDWGRLWRGRLKYNMGHIPTISFDTEGLTVMAEARARRYSDHQWISKSMRWSTSTGQPCSVVSRASEAVSEASAFQQTSQLKGFAPQVLMKKVVHGAAGPFANEVLITEGSNTLTGGTLDFTAQCSHYEEKARRLWISNEDNGLQYVDLINGPVVGCGLTPPAIPITLRHSHLQAHSKVPIALTSSPNYDVFISYSGPDKALADWLYKMLTLMGMSVFEAKTEIKTGEEAARRMKEAMENAAVAIIIMSPEYPAKRWTLLELLCFKRRVLKAEERGEVGPAIVPLFFRMGPGQCRSPNILDMKTDDGENIFNRHNFFARVSRREDEVDMQEAMRWIGGLQGIEKPKHAPSQPRPGQNEAMWVEELQEMLERVVTETCTAMKVSRKRFVLRVRSGQLDS